MHDAIVLLLALIFLLAAQAKLRVRESFRIVLARLVPKQLAKVLVYAVPLGELLLGLWLLSGYAPRFAALTSLAVLLGFSATLVLMLKRGIQGCACFGETAAADPSVGLVRNVILSLAAVWPCAAPSSGAWWASGGSAIAAEATVVIGVICLWCCILALIGPSEWSNLREVLHGRTVL